MCTCFDCLLLEDTPDPDRTYRTVFADATFLVYDPGCGQWRPMSVLLEWDEVDPWAAWLVFDADTEWEKEWAVDREMLRDSLVRPVGEGDVRIVPDLDSPWVREMTLSPPSGRGVFRFERLEMEGFLAAVEREIAYAAAAVRRDQPAT